ncbi:HEPN-associated N-terminal domain-containing protein [Hymenobacter jeollabukensis]|nr:HEPN-associated N-terminal domain-containing protein [Hymenobacter jeollabukensis]
MIIETVCSKHFADQYLRAFINQTGTRQLCDVCQESRKCADVAAIAQRIEQDLRREYEPLWQSDLPYNPDEDRFPFGPPIDTNELIESETSIDPYEIIEAICKEIETKEWARQDWILPQSDYMRYGWQSFSRIVKHRMRFVFFSEKNHRLFSDIDSDSLHPQEVLKEVGKLIKWLKITHEYPPGSLNLVRARQHMRNEAPKNADSLGAPPDKYAQANRMSPAGISMFYGAFDKETCLAEIVDYDWKASSVTYGSFTNRVALRLIDFSMAFKFPSLFNPGYNGNANYLREGIVFLNAFVQDLRKPISKKDVHIEYVPTQIVCEYLRYMYAGGQIDGLIYESAKHRGGRCVVLFVDNKESIDEGVPAGDIARRVTAPKLVLQAKSVTRVSFKRLWALHLAAEARALAEIDKQLSSFLPYPAAE